MGDDVVFVVVLLVWTLVVAPVIVSVLWDIADAWRR
jgi:hypothetical protein